MLYVDLQHHLGFAPKHHSKRCPTNGVVMTLRVDGRVDLGVRGWGSHVPLERE